MKQLIVLAGLSLLSFLASANDILVTNMGAKGDGRANCTVQLQRAIDKCAFTQRASAQQVQATEALYLSGIDKDHRVDWQFMCTDGSRSGQWMTIAVPSCWELEGFGHYNYGHDRPPHHEQGIYRTRFTLPQQWNDKRIFIVFEGVMTDA